MSDKPNSTAVLETSVDYIESKLDETIKDFKEAIKLMDSNHRENLKELKSSLRWVIGTCTVIVGLMLTAFSIIINLLI